MKTLSIEEILQIAKTNKNIVKWLGNETINKIYVFYDNCKHWYLLNDKVYFAFDTTKCYKRQHDYLRVLKATQSVICFAKRTGDKIYEK